MEELYRALAQEIVSHCPADYERAQLQGEVEEDWSNFSVRCELPDGTATTPRIGGLSASKIDDALVEVRERMMGQAGATPWSKCTFTYHRDGRFKFDVNYDD